MILNQSDSLELVTSAAVDIDAVVSYRDEGGNAAIPGSATTAIIDDTTTEILAGPASGSSRTVTSISLRNKDSATCTLTVQLNKGATGAATAEIYEATILADGHLHWTPATGWVTTSASSLGVTNTVVLQEDVANALEVMAYADVTGLSFAVEADLSYWFRFSIRYDSAATTTGSAWAIDGPAAPTDLHYTSKYTLTATSNTVNSATAYDIPAAANATSLTTGNVAVIEGFITPSDDGTVIARCFSEVTLSAVTALAGSILEWKRVL